MISLFLGITGLNLLMLALTLGLGFLVKRDPPFWGTYHQLAGVIATFICVAVHCIVFTYFIATAKWVQHAVTVKRLDPMLQAPTRSFRAHAFPAALLAMAVVFITAITGVASFSGYLRSTTIHLGLGWASVVINLLVAMVEYNAISRNGALIDKILAQITPSEPRGHGDTEKNEDRG